MWPMSLLAAVQRLAMFLVYIKCKQTEYIDINISNKYVSTYLLEVQSLVYTLVVVGTK